MASTREKHNAALRRAYSLVETIIVLTIMSVVFATVAMTMHVLVRVNHQMGKALPSSATMLRLSLQLRSDAHDSNSFSVSKDQSGAEAEVGTFKRRDDTIVTYQEIDSGIVRRVMRGETRIQHDLYRLPGLIASSWSTQGEPPSMIMLSLRKHRGEGPVAADTVIVDTIHAALDLHPTGDD